MRTAPSQGLQGLNAFSIHYITLRHLPGLVATADCIHVGAATASFEDLVTVAQQNSTNQTVDVSVENQLHPPLNLGNSFPETRTPHT